MAGSLIGGKAEYKYTDNLTLEGAAGGFWTAEKTGCPATFRVGLAERALHRNRRAAE